MSNLIIILCISIPVFYFMEVQFMPRTATEILSTLSGIMLLIVLLTTLSVLGVIH